MGQQSGTLQWSIGYRTTGTGSYSDGFIQQRVRHQENQNRGLVVQEKTGSTGAISHKVFHFDVWQNVENVSYP